MDNKEEMLRIFQLQDKLIQNCEGAANTCMTALLRQAKWNHKTTLSIALLTAGGFIIVKILKQQQKRIDILDNRLKLMEMVVNDSNYEGD